MKVKILIVITLVVFFTGCIGTVLEIDNKPTIGRELIDIQKAKDEGAITEAEYQQLKVKVWSRVKEYDSKKAD